MHCLHLSGMVPFHTSITKLDTLPSAGTGVTPMQPGIDRGESEPGFSFSRGGVLLCQVSDRIGVRLEARGWFTWTRGGAAVFCSGGRVVDFAGGGFGQIDLTAGLQSAFQLVSG